MQVGYHNVIQLKVMKHCGTKLNGTATNSKFIRGRDASWDLTLWLIILHLPVIHLTYLNNSEKPLNQHYIPIYESKLKMVQSLEFKMLPVWKDISANHCRGDISANKDEKATWVWKNWPIFMKVLHSCHTSCDKSAYKYKKHHQCEWVDLFGSSSIAKCHLYLCH